MKVSEMSLDADLSQQRSEHLICETQEASEYIIDCYPYAMRGFLWGLVLSAVFWVGAISIFLLMF